MEETFTKRFHIECIEPSCFSPQHLKGRQRNINILGENGKLGETLVLIRAQRLKADADGLRHGLMSIFRIPCIKEGESFSVQGHVDV